MVIQLTVIFAVLAYLFGGIVALAIFDIATGNRIRRNFGNATTDAQLELAENPYTNTILNRRAVRLLLLFLTWLFWPLVLVGSIKKDKDVPDKKD